MRALLRAAVLASWAATLATPAGAQRVRISNLSDVNFGTVTNLQADSRRSQNLCVFSNGSTRSYSVSASGNGPGSTFVLSDGTHLLPYQVEWSQISGQSSGVALSPNVALSGQTASASNQFCSTGPSTSASLSLVLRAADLERARQGSYTGSLTILISAE